jgi:hypothetical protein
MLRLYDPRTGQVDDLPATRLLRVHVGGPDLRSHVLADVIRRLAERHRRQVLITTSADLDLTDLNIPPAERADPAGVDLRIGGASGGGRTLPVGPSAAEPTLAWIAEQGLDPLAARLAVLDHFYREPLELDLPSLERADRELRRLRARVAGWAEAPSKPMSAEYLTETLDTLDADLDTAGALRVLRRLDAVQLAPGTKFESVVYLDMMFALDLVRDIGRDVSRDAGSDARGSGPEPV